VLSWGPPQEKKRKNKEKKEEHWNRDSRGSHVLTRDRQIIEQLAIDNLTFDIRAIGRP
jgi:hypothetical protein